MKNNTTCGCIYKKLKMDTMSIDNNRIILYSRHYENIYI